MQNALIYSLRLVLLVATAATTYAASAQVGANTLPQPAPGDSLGLALGIASVPNLRDVGGYKTSGGKTVARGIAYRSDTFNPMSDEEIKKLELLSLKNDYDLRTNSEVKAMPDELPPGVEYHQLNVLVDAKGAAAAELETLLHQPKKANVVLGNGKIEAMFMQVYREFITLPSANQSYSKLFRDLANPQMAPGVFHCTTGKDRTGWAEGTARTLPAVNVSGWSLQA